MPKYTVSFAGLHVVIQYDTDEMSDFLSFLFDDVHSEPVDNYEILLCISQIESTGEYTLSGSGCPPFSGPIGVSFAAVLFDSVIFNLLNRNSHGIAFHAGAVVYKEKVILLPGLSGKGKSSMTACLVTHGFSYLTDELYFVPADKEAPMLPFVRPVCIKADAVTAVSKLMSEQDLHKVMGDKQGLIIPHRALNSDFFPVSKPPALILFPQYLPDVPLKVDKISGAQACTRLMACDVNARNFTDHGFQQVTRIARSTQAYQVTYSSFQGIAEALRELFDVLRWT